MTITGKAKLYSYANLDGAIDPNALPWLNPSQVKVDVASYASINGYFEPSGIEGVTSTRWDEKVSNKDTKLSTDALRPGFDGSSTIERPFTMSLSNSTANAVQGYFRLSLDSTLVASVTAVPEPSAWCLMVAGVASLGVARRFRQARQH